MDERVVHSVKPKCERRSGYKNESTTCNPGANMKFAISPSVLIIVILVVLYLHLSQKDPS